MKRQCCIIVIISFLILATAVSANPGRKTVTIGYFEGGSYYLHKTMMDKLRVYLNNMQNDSLEIIFDPYAYHSAEWKRELCKGMASDLARRKNVDIIIAAGPWVVEDLLSVGFKKPIVAIYQFDPEVTGLIDSIGKPTAPNLTVNYDPDRIKSDMATLQHLFPTEKIGFLYFPSGNETEKMVNKVRRAAAGFGAVVISAEKTNSMGQYSFFNSLTEIQSKIDVLYLPPLWGMTLDMITGFIKRAHYGKKPTYTTEGFLLVEKGAIASNCNHPHIALAKFTADKIKKIIYGIQPSHLPTIFKQIPTLCINLNEAQKCRVDLRRQDIIRAKTIPVQTDLAIESYTLSRVINQAIVENSNFLAIEQIYLKAVAEARKAQSTYYPQLDLTMSAAKAENGIEVARYNSLLNREYFSELIAEQKLFSYPAIKAIHIAKKKMEIQKINLQQAEMDLKRVVIFAYATVLENEDKVETLLGVVDRFRNYREMAITNYRLGLIDTTGISILDENLIGMGIDLFNALGELRISQAILNVLLNRPADFKFKLDRKEFELDVLARMVGRLEEYISNGEKQKRFEQYLIDYGMNNSHQMSKANVSIGIKRDLISLEKGRYYPELNLRGKYSYAGEFDQGLNTRKDAWVIGAILNWSIFSGGARKQNSKMYHAELEEVLYRKDALRLNLMKDILTVANNLYTRITTLPMNYKSRNISQFNLQATEEKFDSGSMPIVEFLTIENNYSNRELELITDMYAFFNTYVELFHILGIGYLTYSSDEEAKFYSKLNQYMAE